MGLVRNAEVLTLVLGPSSDLLLVYLPGFSLPCLLPLPFWTPVFYSKYLTLANRWGNSERIYFVVLPNLCRW